MDAAWHDPADELANELALQLEGPAAASAGALVPAGGGGGGGASSSEESGGEAGGAGAVGGGQGQFTVDGVYFFPTYKDLQRAWQDADLVHRARLPTAAELDEVHQGAANPLS